MSNKFVYCQLARRRPLPGCNHVIKINRRQLDVLLAFDQGGRCPPLTPVEGSLCSVGDKWQTASLHHVLKHAENHRRWLHKVSISALKTPIF